MILCLKTMFKLISEKSTSFIRTDKTTWNLVNNIPQISTIPVISCIGTSRDGKSTSLNMYANWIMQKHTPTGWKDRL